MVYTLDKMLISRCVRSKHLHPQPEAQCTVPLVVNCDKKTGTREVKVLSAHTHTLTHTLKILSKIILTVSNMTSKSQNATRDSVVYFWHSVSRNPLIILSLLSNF